MRRLAAYAVTITLVVLTVGAFALSNRTDPRPYAACFGNAGVEINAQDAYACEHKDADEGGTLYFWVDNETWMFSLHADSNHFHVWGVTDRFNGVFTEFIQEGSVDCQVPDAGYDENPTSCAVNGVAHTFTTEEAASAADFAEYMGEVVPDSAWR